MKTLETTVLSYSTSKLISKCLFCYHVTNISNHFSQKEDCIFEKMSRRSLIWCIKVTLHYYLQTTPDVSPLTLLHIIWNITGWCQARWQA